MSLGAALARPPRCLLVNVTTGESLECLFNPTQLSEKLQVNWNRLTARYQSRTAGGYPSYQRFWSGFSSVTASNVAASGPTTVDATISYTRTNGSTSNERTRFTLVAESGVWKIDATTVIGSA